MGGSLPRFLDDFHILDEDFLAARLAALCCSRNSSISLRTLLSFADPGCGGEALSCRRQRSRSQAPIEMTANRTATTLRCRPRAESLACAISRVRIETQSTLSRLRHRIVLIPAIVERILVSACTFLSS